MTMKGIFYIKILTHQLHQDPKISKVTMKNDGCRCYAFYHFPLYLPTYSPQGDLGFRLMWELRVFLKEKSKDDFESYLFCWISPKEPVFTLRARFLSCKSYFIQKAQAPRGLIKHLLIDITSLYKLLLYQLPPILWNH